MAEDSSPLAAPRSVEFHSEHVERLREAMGVLDVNDEQAKAKVEIEASKVHWSELASSYYTAAEGPALASSSTLPPVRTWVHEEGTPEWKLEVAEDNQLVFRSLQERYPGGFFLDENDLGSSGRLQHLPKWMLEEDGTRVPVEFGLSRDTPFAEGAQAELFHAHGIRIDDGQRGDYLVMKVFKEGTSLRDLQQLFPPSMLAHDGTCVEGAFGVGLKNCNLICGLRLLKSSGRFAFLMFRAWGDLRKLIDERMLHFGNQSSPFPFDMALCIIQDIALGMQELHRVGIIHRDLKAANVLVFAVDEDGDACPMIDPIDPILLEEENVGYLVADFECSVGIVGTRFWRAPEILEAVKNRDFPLKPELFTKEADVYSFGMTCYEILSGGMPFEELRASDYDGVIGGTRPTLPSPTPPWMVNLVHQCWHKDPSLRPPFAKILEVVTHPWSM